MRVANAGPSKYICPYLKSSVHIALKFDSYLQDSNLQHLFTVQSSCLEVTCQFPRDDMAERHATRYVGVLSGEF